MFVGTFEHSLDDKGRVVLPSTFRDQLTVKGYLSQWDKCLGLWTEEGFDDVARRLIRHLDEEYDRLCHSDFASLEDRWRSHLGLLGAAGGSLTGFTGNVLAWSLGFIAAGTAVTAGRRIIRMYQRAS